MPAGRPKHKKPKDQKFSVPKDAQIYELKRIYWALLRIEEKMSKDVTAVKMSEYLNLLAVYREKVDKAKSDGKIAYRSRDGQDAFKTLDSGADDKGDSESGSTQGVGKDGSTDLGVGVSAVNPIT